MIYVLGWMHLIGTMLDISYPLSRVIDTDLAREVALYLNFVVLDTLDFIQALGLLYLFYKMGKKNIRDSKHPHLGDKIPK